MPANTPPGRYGALSIALHWLMLVLITAVCLLMELKSLAPRGSAQRATMAHAHYSLGLAVFVLVWLRIVARLSGGTPPINPAPTPRQARTARWVHGLLYGLMVGLPVLGWMTLSAKAEAIPFFLLQLPPLVDASQAAAKGFKELHELGARIGYLLVAAHAGAALYHHYRIGDNTLARMLPGAPRKR